MSRQTITITIPMPTVGILYRCPFLPIQPGQIVQVSGAAANAVGGMKLWTQQVAPASMFEGNYQSISPGPAGAVVVEISSTDFLWLTPFGTTDVAIITVRDSGQATRVPQAQAAPPPPPSRQVQM